MIHKFLSPKAPTLDPLDCSKLLTENGFRNSRPASSRSTFDLYEADFGSNHFFVKLAPLAHPFGENLALQKEILGTLYPNLLTYFFESSGLVALAVLELSKSTEYSFSVVNRLVNDDVVLRQVLFDTIPPNRTISSLISRAENGLDYFREKAIVSKDLCHFISAQIGVLRVHINRAQPVINHGDVSNPNIFLLEGRPVLLDWEDIMTGYSGYDQIYWLTFLANVNQITQSTLEEIPTSLEVVHATFFLVVLLKEYLQTFREVTQNRISTQERLLSLFQLPTFGQS